MTNNVTTEISNSKKICFDNLAEKLSDLKLNRKAYWDILKSFTNWKKIPIIPPLLINDQLVNNFNEKANNFNQYFSNQCSVIDNNSKLPMNQAPYTTSLLSSVDIKESDILNILKSLDANKAHGHDDISIRMLKLTQKSILKPLKLIFENCLRTRLFPDQWKKANVVPIHKKGDKQLTEYYRPVSLLPICGKVRERLIFNSFFNYFIENNLLSPHQSDIIPGDSCVQQLISVTHEIYNAFDCNPSLEVRGVFLDISKAFDKVWHDGLIYKLKRNGINGDLLRLIESFLSDRYQRVVLNGQASDWNKIKAGVPQGSILGPLFFLIYINDLPSELRCSAKLFADDTSLFSVVENVNETTTNLNKDLKIKTNGHNSGRCPLILTQQKWHKKFYSQGKSLRSFILFSFLMEKMSVVLNLKNISVLC